MSSLRHHRRRRFPIKQSVAVADVGCSCRRLKLSSLLSSLRLKPPHSLSSSSATSLYPSSASSSTTLNSSSSFSLSLSSNYELEEREKQGKREKRIRNRGANRSSTPRSAAAQSVAVVKDSSEPYADFRESMVQMIVENDLYAWDDLNDLLHRFLSLNSPRHHNLIIHAFADLWSGVFSPPSPCRRDNYY